MAFTLRSPAFDGGGDMPARYSCKGEDVSPALEWIGAPSKTASFAIIMEDPDAPGGLWVHWVLWNLPPSKHSLPENVSKRDEQDDGSRQGRNSFGKVGYNGPCPPMGQKHRYFFRAYALDQKLDLAPGATRDQLDAAMKGHMLAQSDYVGEFER